MIFQVRLSYAIEQLNDSWSTRCHADAMLQQQNFTDNKTIYGSLRSHSTVQITIVLLV